MNRNSTFSVLRKLKIIICIVVLKFDFEFLFPNSCRRVALRKKVKVKLKRIKNTVHFFQDTHENVCLIDCYCGKFAGNHFNVLKKHSDFIYLMYIV